MDNQCTVYIGLDVHKASITLARSAAAIADPVVDVGTKHQLIVTHGIVNEGPSGPRSERASDAARNLTARSNKQFSDH